MHEFISGFGILVSYFALCASFALVIKKILKPPLEVFRKKLHLILLGSIFIFVYAFNTWWISVLSSLVFMLVVFPILVFFERFPTYSALLTERKKGEIKASLIVVFSMFSFMISLCWGLFGKKYLVIASVLAWGLGDAAAALVGTYFGKHHLEGKLIEGKKSIEGSMAMFTVSGLSVLIVLLANNASQWFYALVIATLTATVASVVELYTKNGMDTLTCPLAAATVMLPLVELWGGLVR